MVQFVELGADCTAFIQSLVELFKGQAWRDVACGRSLMWRNIQQETAWVWRDTVAQHSTRAGHAGMLQQADAFK